jgi:hypothetical protein
MTRAQLVILLASMVAWGPALADTYVRVEKDGTRTYSDRPLPGGQPVVLQPAQTYSAPASQDPTRPAEERALTEAATFQYQRCELTPSNEQTFQNPESISVSLATEPRLLMGHLVTLSMDGSPLSTEPAAVISQPERGTHTVSAQVTDRSGRSLCSASTTFHVQRTSLNSPTRQAPPPKPRPPRPTPH